MYCGAYNLLTTDPLRGLTFDNFWIIASARGVSLVVGSIGTTDIFYWLINDAPTLVDDTGIIGVITAGWATNEFLIGVITSVTPGTCTTWFTIGVIIGTVGIVEIGCVVLTCVWTT